METERDIALYSYIQIYVIWMGKNRCGRVEIWVDGQKNEGAQKVFQDQILSVMPESECKSCHSVHQNMCDWQ